MTYILLAVTRRIPVAIQVQVLGLPVVVFVVSVTIHSDLMTYILLAVLLAVIPVAILGFAVVVSVTILRASVPALAFILASVDTIPFFFPAAFEDIILNCENLSIKIHETGVPGRTNLLVPSFTQFTLYTTFIRYFGTS